MNKALTPLQVEKIDLDLELSQHSLLRSNVGSIPGELSSLQSWNAHLHFNLFHRILGSNNISRFRAQDLFLPIGPSPSLLIHCSKHFFLMLEVVCCLQWTPNEGQRQKAWARGWCLQLEVVGIPNCHIFSSFNNECFWGTLVVFRSCKSCFENFYALFFSNVLWIIVVFLPLWTFIACYKFWTSSKVFVHHYFIFLIICHTILKCWAFSRGFEGALAIFSFLFSNAMILGWSFSR